jgi:hypothetical protein
MRDTTTHSFPALLTLFFFFFFFFFRPPLPPHRLCCRTPQPGLKGACLELCLPLFSSSLGVLPRAQLLKRGHMAAGARTRKGVLPLVEAVLLLPLRAPLWGPPPVA